MNPAARLAPFLAQAEPEALTLTPTGWTVMVVSVGTVLALVSYCLYRVLMLPPVEQQHLKGPLEIDTGDTTNAD